MFQKNNRNFDFNYYLLLLLNLFFILEKNIAFFYFVTSSKLFPSMSDKLTLINVNFII